MNAPISRPPPYRLSCGCWLWPADSTYPEYLQMWQGCVWHRPPTPQVVVQQPLSPNVKSGLTAGAWLTAITMLVILYVAYHSYKYQGCLFTPGIFQWPTTCF